MKKKIADKWVKALRSGKYKQSRGKLRGPRGYCCLGVLCDLKDSEAWRDENDGFGGQADYAFYNKNGYQEDSTLPYSVQAWADMKTSTGEFEEGLSKYGREHSLVTLNDHRHWSFRQIANFIKKNYKKL